jgi:GTPase
LEKSVLIGIIRHGQKAEQVKEYLDELAFLALTAGAMVEEKFLQHLDQPISRTYIGSGKVAEIKTFILDNKIELAIFDDELSGIQVKNLETEFKCRVIDRTNLILDIFAIRAKTSQARAQVELAQYEYLLPRLTRMWTHLERQRGGIGLRGPGETEIETDRRVIRHKISLLKKKLKEIDRINAVQRKNRTRKVRVALVGYTNAGKSTIMKLLSKTDVFAEDKLFATLDTTVRNVVFENVTFLLSDTVGFIRKLPHRLIESFKSTLDETKEADILLHIVDISHPGYENQLQVVNETLAELNANHKPTLVVFNKIDKLDKEFLGDHFSNGSTSTDLLSQLQKTIMAKTNTPAVFISAKQQVNIGEFRQSLLEMVKETYLKVYPHYPLTISDKFQ